MSATDLAALDVARHLDTDRVLIGGGDGVGRRLGYADLSFGDPGV
jgi:hypothetical protein